MKNLTICYFGIYDKDFGRNKIYISGLKELGVEIIECRDNSKGLVKFFKLWQKHRSIKGKYDAMVVGYPGHIVVPLARLVSNKPIVADLLGSLYDAETHSHKRGAFKRTLYLIVDWLVVKCAHIILLESEAQKKYFEGKFGKSSKYNVVYTGADESIFSFKVTSYKLQVTPFTVLFRGRLTPESGIGYILEAAKLLKGESNIKFKIAGIGYLLEDSRFTIHDSRLENVELISHELGDAEMSHIYDGVSLALGQFENNPRLSRTIPHKAFEAFATGTPYLSGDAPAIREIVREGETGFLIPLGDAKILAEKIRWLANEPVLLKKVGMNAKNVFDNSLSPAFLAQRLLDIIEGRKN